MIFRKTPEKLLAKALKRYDKDQLKWEISRWGKRYYQITGTNRFCGILYTEEWSHPGSYWKLRLYVNLPCNIRWGGELISNFYKCIGEI